MKKRPGLTLAEHEGLGMELHLMNNRIRAISTQLMARYGLSRKVSTRSRRAVKALENLRSELENRMRDDCKEVSDPTVVKTYYPGPHLED